MSYVFTVLCTVNSRYYRKYGLNKAFLIRELEINNRPILGKIFVRIQGVVTGV